MTNTSDPHPMSNCGPLDLDLPPGATCPTCGARIEKLIRDRDHELMRQQGKNPVVRVCESHEHAARLVLKLQEEVAEFIESGEVSELADIAEAVLALAEVVHHVDGDTFEALRKDRVARRGGFTAGMVWAGNR